MPNYTITLTAAENDALAYAAMSPNDWIQTAVHERCRIAMDEIVQIVVQKCLESSIQIPGTKDEIVELGFNKGWVKTAEEKQAELDAKQGIK